VSDIIYGYLQMQERMDLIAISLGRKGLATATAFGIVFACTASLLWGSAALASAWLITMVAFDIPIVRVVGRAANPEFRLSPTFRLGRMVSLTKLSLPLGFTTIVISLNSNIPRYFVNRFSGPSALGFFAATAYLMVAGNLVVNALGQAATPRLAIHYEAGDLAEFKRLLRTLVLAVALIGTAGILAAFSAGSLILRTLYRKEYAQYSGVLVLIMCAAAISFAASILGYAMTAAQLFRPQPRLFVAAAVVCIGASAVLVPHFSISGAAFALILSATAQLSGSAVVVRKAILVRVPSPESFQGNN